MRHVKKSRAVAVVLAMVGTVGLSLTGLDGAAATSSTGRVAVPNAQPSLSPAAVTGRARSTARIEIKVYLADRNAAGLEAALRTVSTPGSAGYRAYLSPAQFRARYAPSVATVAAVSKFLSGNGLQVTDVPGNHAWVGAVGSVSAVEKAFSTRLNTYRVKGHSLRGAAVAPSVPQALRSSVIAVSGLASVSALASPDHVGGPSSTPATAAPARAATSGTQAPPPPVFVNAGPCSAFYGQKVAGSLPKAFGAHQPYAPCGYVPGQLQSAYGLSSSIAHGFDGSGVRVAITDAYASPTILADANHYATAHGQKPLSGNQFKQIVPAKGYRYGYYDQTNGDLCGEQGWYGEETLDVEAVHAVAPGAGITYVAARSCDNGDLADALNTIVDHHTADIVTNSWGGTDESNGSPQLDQVYQQVFYQGALEGIGFYFSSGDSGDGASDNAGTPTVQAPANSPLVTAVGGTSIAIGAKGQRLWETGWQTGKSSLVNGAWKPSPPGAYLYGAGGGVSRVFNQPWYQKGVVPASLSKKYGSRPARVVPDVSAIADPNTGFLVGETQTFPDGSFKYSEYRIGGTSLASPVFAGIMAIADQVAGYSHGFANPALYAAAGTSAFYDAKNLSPRGVVRVDYANGVNAAGGLLTSLRSINVRIGTTLRTSAGYDDVTGVGTPNGSAFIARLL